MNKKIATGTNPRANPVPQAGSETLVENQASDKTEPMKRLTIDISESLHRKIKSQCAMRGTKIVDEVRELLLQKYGNE